ncbi:uncharacterized protein BT62DRAFT_220560 [Guyanagaster necrorhizus]|uniref:Uncharacterized protein n=1 Tax=Guyanagaster necrorhizus TaxID=856835 RepID=A0A9P7VQP6_9AGAR|nr:uncharacterized protein BT62DRAFT_220560 [Guyanagaster necrorhizus MCA 3950]KAG7444690.1 hypothetical protein BT62DRAFT_220560 [Guyanagaster necrorhizus MCA 3950]
MSLSWLSRNLRFDDADAREDRGPLLAFIRRPRKLRKAPPPVQPRYPRNNRFAARRNLKASKVVEGHGYLKNASELIHQHRGSLGSNVPSLDTRWAQLFTVAPVLRKLTKGRQKPQEWCDNARQLLKDVQKKLRDARRRSRGSASIFSFISLGSTRRSRKRTPASSNQSHSTYRSPKHTPRHHHHHHQPRTRDPAPVMSPSSFHHIVELKPLPPIPDSQGRFFENWSSASGSPRRHYHRRLFFPSSDSLKATSPRL